MILIGENIHIISKKVRSAIEARDENFILSMISKQNKMDYIDFNVGPAKTSLEGSLKWLCDIAQKQNSNLKFSLDTTNFNEMKTALENCENKNDTILNSTSADSEKLDKLTDLTKENSSNLVCLTMNKEIGIPKTADERLELAHEIYEIAQEKEIDSQKLFFDPLILPVCVNQNGVLESLNTIKMIKESFENPVKTTVGLSNISNGSPLEMRSLINRTFLAMAIGCGLDSAIVDATDIELIKMIKMLESKNPQNSIDSAYLDLAEMMENFGEFEDISFDKEAIEIQKTAKILLGKEIYSHSFTQI